MRSRALLGFFAALTCCRAGPTTGPGKAQTPPPLTARGADAGADLSTARERGLWAALLDRQRCNLLHGCPPASALVALGPGAAARALARLEADAGDRQWRLELAFALRKVRHPAVQAWQGRALRDRLWPLRAYAAAGLGWSRDPAFLATVTERAAEEKHPGALLGLAWGQALAGVAGARGRLARRVRGLPDIPDIRVHLVALQAVRDLRLVEVLPTVRAWLGHPNLFVARDAVQTVRALQDRASIPALIRLLDHPMELVRGAALAALRRFTGLRHRKERRDFEGWCARYCDPGWEGAPAPDSSPPRLH